MCSFLAGAALLAATIFPNPAAAQEQQDFGTRVLTIVSFEVPFQDRQAVMSYMRDYVLPETQLNPNVLNFRVLMHYWGSNAAQTQLLSEYATWADIEAPCGQPCDDYREANPPPEEGTPEYEELARARDLYLSYFSQHSDEIYNIPMVFSRIEGQVHGRVGPPPPPPDGGTP